MRYAPTLPLAPAPGAVKVTLTPDTGLPTASATVTASGLAKAVETAALCGGACGTASVCRNAIPTRSRVRKPLWMALRRRAEGSAEGTPERRGLRLSGAPRQAGCATRNLLPNDTKSYAGAERDATGLPRTGRVSDQVRPMTSADVLDVDRRRPRSAPATAPNAVAAADQIAARVITERRGMVTGHRDDAIERIVSKTVSGDAIERIAGDTDRPWLVAVDYTRARRGA